MIPQLLELEVTSAALQITVVALLALCLLCSAATILVSLYNMVSNPYQTYMGPIGIYSCGSLSGKPVGSDRRPGHWGVGWGGCHLSPATG